ncbi:MAG: thiamine phosphate synthase, partial [Pseudomonadota bacterium]
MAETRAAQPPEPRLALNTPYLFEPAAFADALAHALDAAPVASLRLRLRGVTESELRFAIDALRPVCHSRETALLLTDQPDLVAQTGADGVHLERARDALGETRERLGDGAIIGAGCAASRHLGLIAGELGADYVSFHPVAPDAAAPGAALAAPELFGWWQDLIEVPVVAEGG